MFVFKGICAALSLSALAVSVVAKAQDIQGPTLTGQDPALSGTAFSGQCLPLGQAMDLSAQRDPSVRIAEAERAGADADLKEARSLYRPQVSAFGRTGFGDVGLVDSTLQNQVGVRVAQRVFDFGDAKFARRAARFAQEASGYVAEQARLDAAQGTGLAVLEALEASQRIEISKDRASYFEDQLRSIDSLLNDGGATRTERANVASRLAEAKAILLELEFERDRALQRVTVDTGLETALCDGGEHFSYLQRLAGVFPDGDAAINAALTQNPTARALEQRVRAGEAQEDRQKAGRLPILSVVGISAFSSTGSLGDLTQQNRVGLDVSVPLYSGNAATAQIDRARAQTRDASARLAVHQRELRLGIGVSYRRIEALQALLERRQEVADQAWKRFEAASQQFDFRSITLPELIDARIEYEDAQSQAVETRFDVWREYLELLSLTGDLVA